MICLLCPKSSFLLFVALHCIEIPSWTVPEEFRIWKEKMDAIEKKKLAATQGPPIDVSKTTLYTVPSTVSPGASVSVISLNTTIAPASASDPNVEAATPLGVCSGAVNGAVHAVSSSSNVSNGSNSTGSRKKVVEEEDLPLPVYASQEEAVEAFKALLTDKRVSFYTTL